MAVGGTIDTARLAHAHGANAESGVILIASVCVVLGRMCRRADLGYRGSLL